MIIAGVKDAKNNLSHYLARVKAGEDVVITERGKPIARLVREEAGKRSILSDLAPLIEKGLILMPSRGLIKEPPAPVKVPGKPVSEMVIEDRR